MDENRSEIKEALQYMWHVLVASALFTFLILAAVGVEILLNVLKETQHASEFLMQVGMIGKYSILVIDLCLLIYLLANHTYTYARALPWK